MNDSKEFFDNYRNYLETNRIEVQCLEYFEAFRYGEHEPQKTINFYNSTLEEVKEEFERNPESKKLQEQIALIETYIAKVNKILDLGKRSSLATYDDNISESKKKTHAFYESLPEKLKLKICAVILEFDKFYDDLPLLVDGKFMEIKGDELVCDNKSFLHDYFKSIKPNNEENTKWQSVHKLFNKKTLGSAKSVVKDSALFDQWKKIKDI